MQRIRRWAKEHPAQVKEALAQNPSYVFFEERKTDPTKGPVGAQGVPLTPMASVAVDPRHWRLGTPFVVSVSQESPSLHFTRPVVAQDTGAPFGAPSVSTISGDSAMKRARARDARKAKRAPGC